MFISRKTAYSKAIFSVTIILFKINKIIKAINPGTHASIFVGACSIGVMLGNILFTLNANSSYALKIFINR